MGPHGAFLATAMAVSGTVVVLLLCRQHRPATPEPPSTGSLRPCISGGKEREAAKRRKRERRVHFAEQVVELRAEGGNAEEEEGGHGPVVVAAAPAGATTRVRRGWSGCGRQARGGGMPANRAALYSGILRDRLHRMACSY